MNATHRIAGGSLAVTIAARGAEPQSIRHATAGEVLWQAGPAWPKHAPVLFPIVGQLANDEYVHDATTYRMGRHGFARDRDFTWTARGDSQCTLVLDDDAETRKQYPFAFRLEIAYAIGDDAFVATYTIHNPGTVPLPASLGAHPAFRWPLRDGVAKTAHALTFAEDELEPIRRLTGNLLDPQPHATPIRGRSLALDPALFANDAIVMDRPRSRSVRYAAPGTSAITIAWDGFEQLGLWSNGGDFLCVEPWHGYASPADFHGDFVAKPGLLHVAPGAAATCTMRVRVEAA